MEIRQAKIWVWEQDLENIPLFHPKENIYALGIEGKPQFPQHCKYLAVVKDSSGKLLQKQVPLQFLKENIHPDFLEKLNENKNETGWITLSKEAKQVNFVPDGNIDAIMATLTKPIYRYENDHNAIPVITVRMNCQFSKSKGKIRMSSIEWAILTKDKMKASGHTYQSISDNHMRDVFLPEDILKFKEEACEIFIEENRHQDKFVSGNKPRNDTMDKDWVAWDIERKIVTHPYGQLLSSYFFHIDVKNKNVKINMTVGQISRICYDAETKCYWGIQHNPQTNASK